MKTNEIKAALEKAASSDMRRATRETEILIGQTKLGTVRLQKQEGGFGIFWAEVKGGEIIAKAIEGNPGFIRQALCNIYQVC